jgi:hypothetical protein
VIGKMDCSSRIRPISLGSELRSSIVVLDITDQVRVIDNKTITEKRVGIMRTELDLACQLQ